MTEERYREVKMIRAMMITLKDTMMVLDESSNDLGLPEEMFERQKAESRQWLTDELARFEALFAAA